MVCRVYSVKNIKTNYIYADGFDSLRGAVDYAKFLEEKKPELESLICITNDAGEVLA